MSLHLIFKMSSSGLALKLTYQLLSSSLPDEDRRFFDQRLLKHGTNFQEVLVETEVQGSLWTTEIEFTTRHCRIRIGQTSFLFSISSMIAFETSEEGNIRYGQTTCRVGAFFRLTSAILYCIREQLPDLLCSFISFSSQARNQAGNGAEKESTQGTGYGTVNRERRRYQIQMKCSNDAINFRMNHMHNI